VRDPRVLEVGVVSDREGLADLISFWIPGVRARAVAAASEALELATDGAVLLLDVAHLPDVSVMERLSSAGFAGPAVVIAPDGAPPQLAASTDIVVTMDPGLSSIESALVAFRSGDGGADEPDVAADRHEPWPASEGDLFGSTGRPVAHEPHGVEAAPTHDPLDEVVDVQGDVGLEAVPTQEPPDEIEDVPEDVRSDQRPPAVDGAEEEPPAEEAAGEAEEGAAEAEEAAVETEGVAAEAEEAAAEAEEAPAAEAEEAAEAEARPGGSAPVAWVDSGSAAAAWTVLQDAQRSALDVAALVLVPDDDGRFAPIAGLDIAPHEGAMTVDPAHPLLAAAARTGVLQLEGETPIATADVPLSDCNAFTVIAAAGRQLVVLLGTPKPLTPDVVGRLIAGIAERLPPQPATVSVPRISGAVAVAAWRLLEEVYADLAGGGGVVAVRGSDRRYVPIAAVRCDPAEAARSFPVHHPVVDRISTGPRSAVIRREPRVPSIASDLPLAAFPHLLAIALGEADPPDAILLIGRRQAFEDDEVAELQQRLPVLPWDAGVDAVGR
jgi:hypothetical protein